MKQDALLLTITLISLVIAIAGVSFGVGVLVHNEGHEMKGLHGCSMMGDMMKKGMMHENMTSNMTEMHERHHRW